MHVVYTVRPKALGNLPVVTYTPRKFFTQHTSKCQQQSHVTVGGQYSNDMWSKLSKCAVNFCQKLMS